MLRARLLTAALVVAPLLSGCGGDEPTIAVLVADGADSSSRAVDVDRLTDRVESTCDECRVRVYDAEGDAATQKSQARQAEAASADVVVVVPVDPDDLDTLTAGDLPVVSLGELVPGSDRFVGLESGSLPRQTGSDVEAARDIVRGEEKSMTYVPTGAMSDRAADLAVAYLADEPVEAARAAWTSTGWSPGSTATATSPSTPSPRCWWRRGSSPSTTCAAVTRASSVRGWA